MGENFFNVIKLNKNVLKDKYGLDLPVVNDISNIKECYDFVLNQFRYSVEIKGSILKRLKEVDESCQENCNGLFLVNKNKVYFMLDSDRFWFVLNWIHDG